MLVVVVQKSVYGMIQVHVCEKVKLTMLTSKLGGVGNLLCVGLLASPAVNQSGVIVNNIAERI